MRRMIILLVAIFLTLTPLAPAWAQDNAAEDPWATTDKGGTFEKIVASLVTFPIRISRNLLEEAGFKPLDHLVFQEDLNTEEQKRFSPWVDPLERQAVRNWFTVMCAVTAPFFIVVIAASAFKFFHAAANPAARAEAAETVQRWFLAVGIIILAPFFLETVMWLTSILLDAVKGAFQAVAEPLNRGVGDWGVDFAGLNIATGSVLGTALVKLAFFLIWCYLNVIYIIRKLALTVFFVFTPIMAIMWAINKNATAATVWLGEIASNAFMPVAHALVLGTILLLCDVKNVSKDGSWLTMVIMLYTAIPLAEVLRNSLQSLFVRLSGMSEQGVARHAMAALGMGGVLSLARLGAASLAARPSEGEGFDLTPPHGTGGSTNTLAPSPVKSPGLGGFAGESAVPPAMAIRQAGSTSPDVPGGEPAPPSGRGKWRPTIFPKVVKRLGRYCGDSVQSWRIRPCRGKYCRWAGGRSDTWRGSHRPNGRLIECGSFAGCSGCGGFQPQDSPPGI